LLWNVEGKAACMPYEEKSTSPTKLGDWKRRPFKFRRTQETTNPGSDDKSEGAKPTVFNQEA